MHTPAKSLLFIIAIALFFTHASAFVGEFNNYIVVRNVPSEFSFTVTNNDSVERQLEMQILVPGRYEVLRNPGVIEGGATEEVVVRILPDKDLEGSEFVGSILLKLGSNTAEKNLKILYTKPKNCAVSIAPLGAFDGKENKFTIKTELENNGVVAEKVELKAIRGIPDDWKVEGTRQVEVDGGAIKSFETVLVPGSNYIGKAELVYECGAFIVERLVIVKFERPLNNPFEGIATGFAGLFSGFSIPEGITGLALPDGIAGLVIDVILIVVAAVLLIAFIARVVKRIGRRPPSGQNEMSSYDTVEMGKKPQEGYSTPEEVAMHEQRKKNRGKLESYNPKLEELKDRINGVYNNK